MNDQLVDALLAAVPLALADLNTFPPEERPAVIERWRVEAIEPICAHGDVLQYGAGSNATRKDRARVADTFAALARGLAVLSTAPGGVAFAGVLWCATHAPHGHRAVHPCAECLAPGGEHAPVVARRPDA